MICEACGQPIESFKDWFCAPCPAKKLAPPEESGHDLAWKLVHHLPWKTSYV